MKSVVHNSDCLEAMRRMPDASIDLIITSPPYNCRKEYGDFDDQMPWPKYYEWMENVIAESYRLLVVGGTICINVPTVIKWQREHRFAHTWADFDPTYPNHVGAEKHFGKGRIEPLGTRIESMMRQQDSHLREPIIWVKGSDGNAIAAGNQMGCDSDPYLRGTHEAIYVGSKGRWFHRGGTGRRGLDALPYTDYHKDVWHIPPVRDIDHPATFPVEIPLRLIRLFIHAADAVILDPFCGTASTGVAAIMENCSFIGIERDARFAQICRSRLEGVNPTLFEVPQEALFA